MQPAHEHRSAAAELLRAAAVLGLTLTSAQQAAFGEYVDSLLIWRRRLSLTTAATPLTVVQHHIADSLQVSRYVRPGWRVADIGSGAGFPGVPLAIACPQVLVALIESRRRRANFLREVLRRTGIENATVIEGRAEAEDTNAHGRYDLIVSRALGTLPDFLALAHPLLKSAGLAVAMKGPKGRAEAAAMVEAAEFCEPEVSEYTLSNGAQRTLLAYQRRSP